MALNEQIRPELGSRMEISVSPERPSSFPKDLFADTWWYGLTARWTEEDFKRACAVRKEQGFNAVQFVVGVPPEIGPAHPSARSDAGFPYNLKGKINHDYLALARERASTLKDQGLKPIIYGAWGHQIGWFGTRGVEFMKEWWRKIVDYTEDLEPVYCLTGESNFLLGREKALYPDKSSDDIFKPLPDFIRNPLVLTGARSTLIRKLNDAVSRPHAQKRIDDWSEVLSFLHGITDKPIIIHTNAGEISVNAVNNPVLLAAVTTQTGHCPGLEDWSWRTLLRAKKIYPDKPFFDLEPPYERITGNFGTASQLDKYWRSRLAGAHGFFYGAHGMWQLGNGNYMKHWGSQSWQEALALETPALIEKSDALWKRTRDALTPAHQLAIETDKKGELVTIGREDDLGRSIVYYPDASRLHVDGSVYWLPQQGEYCKKPPQTGSIVAINM